MRAIAAKWYPVTITICSLYILALMVLSEHHIGLLAILATYSVSFQGIVHGYRCYRDARRGRVTQLQPKIAACEEKHTRPNSTQHVSVLETYSK